LSTIIPVESYPNCVASSRVFAEGNLSIRTVHGSVQTLRYGNGDGFKSSHAQRVDVSVPGGQWQLAISSESIEEDKNSRLCGYFFYEIFSTETQVG